MRATYSGSSLVLSRLSSVLIMRLFSLSSLFISASYSFFGKWMSWRDKDQKRMYNLGVIDSHTFGDALFFTLSIISSLYGAQLSLFTFTKFIRMVRGRKRKSVKSEEDRKSGKLCIRSTKTRLLSLCNQRYSRRKDDNM